MSRLPDDPLPISAARVVLLALAATALVFLPGFLFPYMVPRAAFLRLAVLAAAAFFLPLLLLRRSRVHDGRDPFLLLLTAWFGWSLVTALAGDAPWRSVFGDLERMEGLVTWGLLLVLYVMLRSLFRDRHWRRFFIGWAVAMGAVSVYALVQRWNPAGLALHGAGQGRIFGTLGNPGFLAAYLVLSWSTVPWLWRRLRSRWGRALLAAAVVLSAPVFLSTGSRAAAVGLVVGGTVVLAWAARKDPRRGLRVATGVALALAAAIGLTVVGLELHTLERLLAGDVGGFDVRLAVWKAGLEGILESPLLGVGPENFNLVSDRHLPAGVFDRYGTLPVWDRAHNVLVGTAATRGVPGLLVYLGLWAVVLRTVVGAWSEGDLTGVEAGGLAAGLLAFAVHLVFWFEDLTSLVMWVTLAAFLRHVVAERPLLKIEAEPLEGRGRRVLAAGAVVVLALTGWSLAVRPLLAAGDAGRAGVLEARSEGRQVAVSPGAADSTDGGRQAEILEAYREGLEHSGVLGWEILVRQVNRLAEIARHPDHLRRHPSLARAVEAGIRTAAERTEVELRRDPANGRVHLKHGQLLHALYAISGRSEVLDRAVEATRRGVERAPARLDHRLVLASILLDAGQSERALAVLEEVVRRAPGWGRARVHLALAEAARGGHGGALTHLRSAFRSGHAPESPFPTLAVGSWLRTEGRWREEAALYASHLATVRPGPFARWAGVEREAVGNGPGHPSDTSRASGGTRSDRLARRHLPVLGRLPPALLRAGDREGAVEAARILLEELLSGPGRTVQGSTLRPALRFAEEVEAGAVEPWRDRTSLLPGTDAEQGAAPLDPSASPPPGADGPPL